MTEVITWISYGGKFELSSKYVGGDTEILLVNNDVDYNGLKHMIVKLLNVDQSSSKMLLSFQIGNPSKPIYDVIDDKTVKIFISFAQQDLLKHSLMVTFDDECFRSTQGSNDPFDQKKESLNMNGENVAGLESIPEGTPLGEESNVVGTNLFPHHFGNCDSPEVSATPAEENVTASDNVSQMRPPFELCTNVPPIGEHNSLLDENDAGFGDDRSRSDGICGPSGISKNVEEYQIFKSKKDLNKSLSLLSMWEKFNYKIFKSNAHFTVVRCLDVTCPW